MPFSGEKVKMAVKIGKEGHHYCYMWKNTKVPGERVNADTPLLILPRL
jgi:hypothetical protein